MSIDGKEFADAIDRYCEGNNVLKDEFFRATGITSASLSQWRTGKVQPSLKKIRTVEKYIGMQMEQILNGFQTEKNPAPEGREELIRLFEAASPELQAAALAVLKSAEARPTAQDAGRADQ